MVYKNGDYVMMRDFDATTGVSHILIPMYKGSYLLEHVEEFQSQLWYGGV